MRIRYVLRVRPGTPSSHQILPANQKISQKFFVPQKIFPVCPCPTPLSRGAENTFISYGICDVKIPEYPSMRSEGGSGRGRLSFRIILRVNIFKTGKNSEKKCERYRTAGGQPPATIWLFSSTRSSRTWSPLRLRSRAPRHGPAARDTFSRPPSAPGIPHRTAG